VRALALRRIREAGATLVRIPVDWRSTVAADPPAGFDAGDPASSTYSFTAIDAAVESAVSAGETVLLVISHAPGFAEAPGRWPYAYPGSWDPSPSALEGFAAALARRYDGSFPDPLSPGRALPRVRFFQAWNEPNLARYLEPQWVVKDGRWSAFSPLLYRQLLNAFYAGVKSVSAANVVVTAGVAPNGERAGVGRMAPIRFLADLLCVAAPGGRSGGRIGASCPNPPHFDVLDFHPLSVGNPDLPAASSLDVAIADAAKVSSLLKRAARLHTVLPRGDKPMWVTELNWESAPASPAGVPGRLQAQWVSRALHRLWIAGVSLACWQFLIDPYPGVRAGTETGGTVDYRRPAGLYSAGAGGDPASAKGKPFLLGFTFPFDPLRVSPRRVRVWALLMRPRQAVLLQRQHGLQWRTVARLRAGSDGVLNAIVGLTGRLRLRVQSGALRSGVSVVPATASPL
jgi:hypothetical protein